MPIKVTSPASPAASKRSSWSSSKNFPPQKPSPRACTIRPARGSDIPQISSIFAYYASHTVLTFNTEPRSSSAFNSILKECTTQGLPFLVAIDDRKDSDGGVPLAKTDTNDNPVPIARSATEGRGDAEGAPEVGDVAVGSDSDSATDPDGRKVLGWSYVGTFREGKDACKHTGELSIFLLPQEKGGHQGQGVGTALLGGIVAALEAGGRIKQLLGMVAIEADKERAELLRKFYEQRGFSEAGIMRKVGYKFGGWVDVRIIQKEIVDSSGKLDAVKEAMNEGRALPVSPRPQMRRASSGTHRRWSYSIR